MRFPRAKCERLGVAELIGCEPSVNLCTELEGRHTSTRYLQASTHFSRPTVDSSDDGIDAGFAATSTLEFRLSKPAPSSDPNDEDEPCVVVRATLEASYAFKDDSTDFSEEQLKTFALHYCPFHVWGTGENSYTRRWLAWSSRPSRFRCSRSAWPRRSSSMRWTETTSGTEGAADERCLGWR